MPRHTGSLTDFFISPPIKPQPLIPNSAIHAPLSVFPSPFPRRLFSQARQLQNTYNILYARIATDVEFLDKVMGAVEGVGKVDDFVGQLWTGWKNLRDEGLVQPLHLGLFRSDYLLHAGLNNEPLSLKQVEFNTISSSFGPLSERTAALHRYLYATTSYYNVYPDMKPEDFPPNNTTAGLARGTSGSACCLRCQKLRAKILFVVQAGERNVFDQRWLEYELLEKHSIHVIRQTFDQLAASASLDPATRALLISDDTEISTVYFRAGYTPTDFPTAAQYSTRFLLERSKAIKCPSIPLQLAGGKKIQQVLTQPGVLERFLGDAVPAAQIDELRDSWMAARVEAPAGRRREQRYKEAIPAFLDDLSSRERQAWIAMELIVPPEGTGNYLVRAGSEGAQSAVKVDVVSELGIFGWALFGGQDGGMEEKEVGWLVRTKGKDSNEGGVATGFSVLDSLLLVDD
ncbi:Glutathione synthetase [Mycena venus]|uniref:Glutathione synthetase n=1 Tax=Mycena venus TaxID=2733690 RepID=A0A8H6XNA0_9AGAR|nr:Glutathione synthetase [Mycena venus]